MSTKAFIDLFHQHPEMTVFHLNDLSLLLGINKAKLQVELYRMKKRGVVKPLANGYYANPFHLPSLEYVAMILKKPSYISLETALNKYGLLPQTVFLYSMVTTQFPHQYEALDTVFEYHHIQASYFFGFQEMTPQIFMAEPEKALLDLIYLKVFKQKRDNRYVTLSLIDNMDFSTLNQSKFSRYAKQMHLSTFIKKYIEPILSK